MKSLLYLFFIFIVSKGTAQIPDKEGSLVKWLTLQEAMKKNDEHPKPILIDFYTDWCGWCKKMMKTTYADPGLSAYINMYFYPVKFNAEGKDTVEYLGEKFLPTDDKPRTTHPLAVKLLNNKLMYPSTLFLNNYDKEKKEFKLNMIANGYLEKQKIEPILIFTVENAGRNSTYDDFSVNFNKTFYDTTGFQKDTIIWLFPQRDFTVKLDKKKKTLVFINTPWCNTCRVMKTTTFTDSLYKSFLTENFNLIDFNPEITDTLIFQGKQYTNPKNPQLPFHELAVHLGKNSISFPSVIILDEELKTLDVIASYIPINFMNDILHFYGENKYKTQNWQEFISTRTKSSR